jgi:hypothetical protein
MLNFSICGIDSKLSSVSENSFKSASDSPGKSRIYPQNRVGFLLSDIPRSIKKRTISRRRSLLNFLPTEYRSFSEKPSMPICVMLAV